MLHCNTCVNALLRPAELAGCAAGRVAEGNAARADSPEGSAQQSTGGASNSQVLVPATPEDAPDTPCLPAAMPMGDEMRDHIQVSFAADNLSQIDCKTDSLPECHA